jgi:RNase P subunit RPR2
MKAYCMKCKKTMEMVGGKEVTMKNGRKAMKGTCTKCGTGMFRIM